MDTDYRLSRWPVDGWAAVVVAVALVVTPLLAHGVSVVWWWEAWPLTDGPASGWAASVVVSALVLALASRGNVSRWVRAAVVIPIVHVFTIAVAWYL